MVKATFAVSALAVLLLVAPSVSAQVPPTCFGFNMTSGAAVDFMTVPASSPLTVYFAAPQTVTVDQIVLFDNEFYFTSVNVAVHSINPATGAPLNPPLATAPGSPYFSGSDWVAKSLSAPVSFAGGGAYAIVCTAAPYTPAIYPAPYVAGIVGVQTSPVPTLLTFTGGGYTGAVPPGATQLGFRFGFQGPGCGARIAEVFPGGPPCGGAPAWVPLLFPVSNVPNQTARPVIGQSMALRLEPNTGVNTNLPAALFWSFGANLAGSPISPVCPCIHYLNPVSFATLTAGGFEPLATPTFWSGGSAWFTLAVPNLPALIGTPIAVQGVLVDPAGVPSGAPGLNIRLSNSLTFVPGL